MIIIIQLNTQRILKKKKVVGNAVNGMDYPVINKKNKPGR